MEGASHLDLDKLANISASTQLILSKQQLSIISRPLDLFLFGMIVISEIGYFVRWWQNGSPVFPIVIMLIILASWRKNRIRGIYIFADEGLIIPYTWLSRKLIRWDQIISIEEVDLTEKETGTQHKGVSIELDTPLIRFNTTGMSSPSIVLSTKDYDQQDLTWFTNKSRESKRKSIKPPNTLAQRLDDQVNRAWKNRNKLVLLNTVDSFSEAVVFLLILEGIIFGFSGESFWILVGGIIFFTYLVLLILIQYLERPSAIIGIRPHELGPLLYDDAEILTTVRFIMISYPNNVELIDCNLIFSSDSIKQVDQMKQMHPKIVEPGQLVHGVAQIYGNHMKALGANIRFSYVEHENDDTIYEVPLLWD